MVVTNRDKNILRKLEDILEDFGKNIFNINKRVPVDVEEADLTEIVLGDVCLPFEYKNGRIYVKSGYLNFFINNYKKYPEVIVDFLKGAIHEYIHAILDADPKKEKTKKYLIAHEGVATLVGDIYKRIASESKIDLSEALEDILENVNKYVMEKIKNKEYLKKLDEELRSKFSENVSEELNKLLEKYNRCIETSVENLDISRLRAEIKHHVVHKIPSLILQNNLGILKIMEDISREVPLNVYQKIIFEEFEKIPGKEIVANALDCLYNKEIQYFDNIINLTINLESKIESLKSLESLKE